MTAAVLDPAGAADRFEHDVLFYRDDDSFLAGLLPFIRDGLEQDEAVVIAEPRARLELLRDALGDDAAAVQFLDMAEIGANPAWIIGVFGRLVPPPDSVGGRGLYLVHHPCDLVQVRISGDGTTVRAFVWL